MIGVACMGAHRVTVGAAVGGGRGPLGRGAVADGDTPSGEGGAHRDEVGASVGCHVGD